MTPARAAPLKRIWIWTAVILVLGFIVRLCLLLYAPPENQGQEPVRIAVSLVNSGRYADAYGENVGPTAHCAPLLPLIVSVPIRIFGAGAESTMPICLLESAVASLAFALLPVLAMAIGIGLRSGVVAGIVGALLPVNYWVQSGSPFDAPYTAVALVVLCILLCGVWRRSAFGLKEGAVFGTVAGIGCLMSPALIPVLAGWAALSLFVFRAKARSVLRFLAAALLCAVVVLLPWAIRNRIALGSTIWTRSNFGLELRVSNNDVVTADLERNVRMKDFASLHPLLSEQLRDRIRHVGEVEFMHEMKRDALAWIASHKHQFLLLTAERFRLYWLPRMRRTSQSLFEAALTAAGLGGLVLLWRRQRQSAWLLGTVLVTYPLVYYIIQASPRYRFPVECLLFVLAAASLEAIARHFTAQKGLAPA
ncbi:MAG TPA: hypothetical protein VMJ34_07630 [Bryobacteraceae bacterium]|nr:hypothetical protein [Bryobacteraceae bacterium]